MRSFAKLAGWVGLLAVTGCAAADRGDNWLADLRAREAQLPETRLVGSGDGSFAAEVPAAMSGPVTAGAAADLVAFDIGSASPIECALYHDEVESASTLQTLAAQVFADLGARYEGTVDREVALVDAGAAGPSPFLELHWRYRAGSPDAETLGELKQAIANREGRSIYCVHHENGYAASFREVFRALIGSIRFAEYDQLRPYFTMVDVLEQQGRRSGFTIVTLTLDEDGDPRIVRYTARLDVSSDDELSARDVTEVEHATLAGILRGKVFTDYRNGTVASSLALDPVDGETWRVEGEHEGTALRASFVAPRLVSWLGEVREYRALIAAGATGRTSSSEIWAPEIRVANGTTRSVTLMRQVEGEHYTASVEIAAMQQRVVVDQRGLPVTSREPTAAGELVRERVFVEGSLY